MKLIGTIIDFVFFFVKRWITKKDSPDNQYQQAKDQDAKAIIQGDQDAINSKLDDLTRRL
jgi:hypothetical protein